jgi:hypothetical protein
MAAKDCKPLPELSESDIDRFWNFVDTAPGHGPKGTCWIWNGAQDRGYGVFTIKGRNARASRIAWKLASGSDPFPLNILHKCDYPPCVRFDHLRTGTKGDNTIDARNKGRIRNGSENRIKKEPKPKVYICHDQRRFTFRPIPEFTKHEVDAFWSKVDIRSADECWPWLGALDRDGYGHFLHFVAARVAFAIQKGEDPGPFYACHSCDSPTCVNGKHLFRGTQQENMQDAKRKGRIAPTNHGGAEAQRGEKNHRAVLTDEQVSAIRTLHREHPEIPQRQIARTYEIHPTHVGDILTYKIWKHLP